MVLFVRCMCAQYQTMHRIVFAFGFRYVRQPLGGQRWPFQCVRHHQIVQERCVFLPYFVFLVNDALLNAIVKSFYVQRENEVEAKEMQKWKKKKKKWERDEKRTRSIQRKTFEIFEMEAKQNRWNVGKNRIWKWNCTSVSSIRHFFFFVQNANCFQCICSIAAKCQSLCALTIYRLTRLSKCNEKQKQKKIRKLCISQRNRIGLRRNESEYRVYLLFLWKFRNYFRWK